MSPTPPITVSHLFSKLDDKLIELLSSLSKEEWHAPTIAKLWTVKDIAAHLLDGNIRTLSMSRDNYFGLNPDDEELLSFLNRINAEWVTSMKRTSPQVLLWLLQMTGKSVSEHYQSLDPFTKAIFPVSWAGETESLNWMHVAREYTEKFIHQQQIRDAVNKQGIITKELFYPLINTFMQALPFTYRNANAENGTIVKVSVTTDAGGDWSIIKSGQGWKFLDEGNADASISIDPHTAWKLFSKGITPEQAKASVTMSGNLSLAEVALNMVSVMA
jgi:uncharacterized protein (TIGR03083 family)